MWCCRRVSGCGFVGGKWVWCCGRVSGCGVVGG